MESLLINPLEVSSVMGFVLFETLAVEAAGFLVFLFVFLLSFVAFSGLFFLVNDK